MNRLIAMLLAAAFFFCGCAPAAVPSASTAVTVGGSTRRAAVESEEIQFSPPGADAVYATLVTGKGDIRVVLYPQYAPLAVENFCTLAAWGYYDGTLFHRVVRDFAIQAGDAGGSGRHGASIWGVPFATEATERLRHYSGALCMAAADGQAGTHTSQFYIVATGPDALDEAAVEKLRAGGWREEVAETYRQAGGAPYLDHTDTVFGQVVAGMDVVDAICAAATEEGGQRPKEDVRIERLVIENYPPAWMQVPPSEKDPPAAPAPSGESAPVSVSSGAAGSAPASAPVDAAGSASPPV